MRAKLVFESLQWYQLDRKLHKILNLDDIDICYHWLTEGKLFDACYNNFKGDDSKYILRKGPILEKPIPSYKLGNNDNGICITVDPNYTDVAFNEDGPCIIFDLKKLKKDYEFENLTDNDEAELRISEPIINWPKYCIKINIIEKNYLKGVSWEDFRFRAIEQWIPDELKSKVETFKNMRDLQRKRMMYNN